jgi:hypothetical protein
MLGGMSGGGMGFIFEPGAKARAQERLENIMRETKRRRGARGALRHGAGGLRLRHQRARHAPTFSPGDTALMPSGYYTLTVPALLRRNRACFPSARRAELDRFAARAAPRPSWPAWCRTCSITCCRRAAGDGAEAAQSLAALLDRYGFDRVQHEQIRADLRSGRIGLAQNRLPASSRIEDVDRRLRGCGNRRLAGALSRETGLQALADGMVAVVSLAGGAGSRWTKGAGVVKALNPFCKLAGGIAISSKPTWPRAAAPAACAARRCLTSSPPAI